jgi:hypothetical protein
MLRWIHQIRIYFKILLNETIVGFEDPNPDCTKGTLPVN